MMSNKKVCQPSADEYNKCVGSVLERWEIWVPKEQENWMYSDSEVSARTSCHGHNSREKCHRSQALTPPTSRPTLRVGWTMLDLTDFTKIAPKPGARFPRPMSALAVVPSRKMLGSSSVWNLLDPLRPRYPTHCRAFPKHVPKTQPHVPWLHF